MIDTEVQSCTVCGNTRDNKCLFEKNYDGRGVDSILVYQCEACKTVYLGKYSPDYDDGLYAYYSKYSGKSKTQVYDSITRDSYFQVLELLKSWGGGRRILDVGCGHGGFVDAAMELGYDIAGIELSQSAVDIAQKFNLPVKRMDFFSTEIQSSSFDIITMFEVIEHLPMPVSFLQRAEGVLKPGGLIYLTTPNYNSLDRRVFVKHWNVFHREHLTYFAPATLAKTITDKTGLEVLHVETRNISGELIDRIKELAHSFLLRRRLDYYKNLSGGAPRSDARAMIAGSPLLSMVKRAINLFLDVTGLGGTIVMVLKRPL